MTLATSALAQSSIILVILPIAGFAATIIIGAAGVWIAYAAGFPHQRLLYWIPAAVPLVDVPQNSGNKLRLLYQQTEVTQPYLLSVQLISRGRRDIPSTSFDGDKPLSLNLSVPIIDVLQVRQVIGRRGLPDPKISFRDDTLEIGPSLLGKKQVIIITLLLDGRPAPLELSTPLTDVIVRKRRRLPTFLNWSSLAGMAAAMAAASVALIALAVLATNQIYVLRTTPSFLSNIKALNAVVDGLLSDTTEQIYIALASISVLLALLAGSAAWALGRNRRAPWWL